MKRLISLGVASLAVLAFVAAATGAATPATTYGPYTVATTDGGCGGNQWANDAISRTFQVKKGPMGTWRVTRIDRGTFTTLAGLSPGNCASNTSAHGTTVIAGVTGKLHGRLAGVVSGGTYNPSATCTNACGTTSTFVSTYFGPSAQYSCLTGVGSCTYVFKYRATKQQTTFHNWVDKGNNTSETFTGDIATG